MNLYRIDISSVGDGWTDRKTGDGEITEDNGAINFRYSIDGDECILTIADGKVIQKRRGEQRVEITFVEGEKTKCTIGSGSFSGSFEIFTRRIKIISGKGGYFLSLEYINGSDNELIKLNFTAVKKGFKNEN